MISDGNGKPESRDPEQMMKMLEIELAQKRAEFTKTSEHYRGLRTASFLFLALVIMGAVLVFFFFILPRLGGLQQVSPAPASSATPSH